MTGAICWVEAEPRPGWRQMARDAAMLELAEATGLTLVRLYGWSPPCLSFGCHEPASRRYDRGRIAALGLDCVRRPTGGRAVWHARELTYAVAGPTARLGSLGAAYLTIHEWLAGALRRLGARPALAPRRPAPGVAAGPCFAAAVGGELVVGGRKVLGSAQQRRGGALLQHGSLLLEDDQRVVRSVLAQAPAAGADPPEAPLAAVLGRPVAFGEAAAAVAAELEERGFPPFGATGPAALEPVAERHAATFRSADWTWRR